MTVLIVPEGQQVPSELFTNKVWIGFIVVEALYDVIAIAPRIIEQQILVEPIRVGVACQVQPVTSPAFTEVRRLQQAIDDFCEGLLRAVLKKIIDLGDGRRQADQIKGCPPD